MRVLKYTVLLILLVLLWIGATARADNGDTIVVQTFTYGSPQNAWFSFPSDTVSFRKILLYYTLKCNPNLNPYPCGEWDYITNTYLYQHTGIMDSTLLHHSNYIVEGASPDSFMYSGSPTWSYLPYFLYYNVNTDTLAINNFQFGQGAVPMPVSLNNLLAGSVRCQFLWKASELQSAGLMAGNITALSLNFSQECGLNHLNIRMTGVSADTLSQDFLTLNTFTDDFDQTYSVVAGWNKIVFDTPYAWDGNSSVLIDICYSLDSLPSPAQMMCDSTNFDAGNISSANDDYLDFDGHDFIDVPYQAFTELDSAVTVTYWQFGNPAVQPQSSSFFEGSDSLGTRVINVHCPWSDGNVYWDAGNNGGSYDRINNQATPDEYEGKWNHWAFTKNAATGLMKIYLNGQLWHSGTGFTRLMQGIRRFRIGSSSSESLNYNGNVDEFSMWNKELSQAEIDSIMYRDISQLDSTCQHLLFYYRFNDGTGIVCGDESQYHQNGHLMGLPQWKKYKGCELFRNFHHTSLRPEVIFEQGEFISYPDSVLVVDSVENPLVSIILYDDTLDPVTPTDTLYVFPPQYSCTFAIDSAGITIDSTLVPPDSTIHLVIHDYHSAPFEVVNRFELLRFITPYGINLDLGNDGFTWIYDITDYRPLLKDSVNLSAGNWQELLDVKFVMIKGIPPRNVLNVQNVWNGNWYLSQFDQMVQPKTIQLDPDAHMFNLRIRTSGHGMSGASDCAEFCPKLHSIEMYGDTIYKWMLWKKCAMNPLYP